MLWPATSSALVGSSSSQTGRRTVSSRAIESRGELERAVADLERTHAGRELPLPGAWGGFRLAPESIEFWQQRRDRLHDRLHYRRDGGAWVIERLAP